MNDKENLLEKIVTKSARVGIIGLGYVGSALLRLISEKGFTVIGFDKVDKKIQDITKQHFPRVTATRDTKELATCDIIIICIQTPIYENKTPNFEYLENAAKEIAPVLQNGQLIVVESSINPGATRNIVLPILQTSQKKIGEDFFLTFSPERIDPGNISIMLQDIPKVVSGYDNNSLELISLFYTEIFSRVIPVSSLETAEMVKVFENTFRFINISFVNEMREYTDNLGIDMWEIIDAAATKPFGFLAHYPGPGIGGHCIPVDPFYLWHDAKKRGITLEFIGLAGTVNDQQPSKVVEKVLGTLHLHEKEQPLAIQIKQQNNTLSSSFPSTLHLYAFHQEETMQQISGEKGGSTSLVNHKHELDKKYKILLIGVTYKPDIDDVRESSALRIWELFEKLGHHVSYHDPYVPSINNTESIMLSESSIADYDACVITTPHKIVGYDTLLQLGKPIFDTHHILSHNIRNVYYV